MCSAPPSGPFSRVADVDRWRELEKFEKQEKGTANKEENRQDHIDEYKTAVVALLRVYAITTPPDPHFYFLTP